MCTGGEQLVQVDQRTNEEEKCGLKNTYERDTVFKKQNNGFQGGNWIL